MQEEKLISPKRRIWLKAMGGTSLVLVGGTVWRMSDQGVFSAGTGPAYAPWTTWRTDEENSLLAIVRAAILAANPHNTQPWLFHLGETSIDVFADTTRNIGAIDPDLREMFVGLGCALENMVIAAEAAGLRAEVRLMPNPADTSHAARIDLLKGGQGSEGGKSELYDAIPRRHTNRTPYDLSRNLSGESLKQLDVLGQEFADARIVWFADAARRAEIGQWVIRATEAVIADRQQSADSARWVRSTWQEVQAQRDGITIDAQGLSPLIRAVVKTLPPLSQEQNDAGWLRNTKEVYVGATPVFGLLVVRNNRNRRQRMMGGRLWQRLQLWGTLHGLGMQPLNQMSERADRETQLGIAPEFGNALRGLVGDPGWQALMPFRIGYPLGEALASPRRDVNAVLR